MEEQLTFMDYITKPFIEICQHPNFSQAAMDIVCTFVQLTSDELVEFDRRGGINNGRS